MGRSTDPDPDSVRFVFTTDRSPRSFHVYPWIVPVVIVNGIAPKVGSVNVPLPAILAVYANENGQGISFPEPETPGTSPDSAPDDVPPRPVRPVLRRVK